MFFELPQGKPTTEARNTNVSIFAHFKKMSLELMYLFSIFEEKLFSDFLHQFFVDFLMIFKKKRKNLDKNTDFR